jgi:hypothetical protein
VGLPSSPVEFFSLCHSHRLSHSWLLGACLAPARGSPARPACLFTVYLQSQEGFPSPNLQLSGCPTLFPACLNCFYCLLLSFSFFPRVEISLSRGLCCSGPGLSVGVPPRSSPGPCLPKPSGCQPLAAPGALLVSLFNVRWRFSVPAGDVEGSKLCLFSVIMPAKCVSSVSSRFHYRRLAFCFLPLATILEFLYFSLIQIYLLDI